jgi:hypothetical protein
MYACKKNVSYIRLPMLKNEYTNETNPDKYMTSFYKELLDFNNLCHSTLNKSDSTETFLVWKTLKEIDQHLMHLKLMNLIDKKLEENKNRDNSTQTDFNDEIIVNKQENVAQIVVIQNEANESIASINENSTNKEEMVEENNLKEEIDFEKEKIDLGDLSQHEVNNEK